MGLQGPTITSVAACASSIYGFIDALHLLQRGEADVALVGGTESNVWRRWPSPGWRTCTRCRAGATSRSGRRARSTRIRDGFVLSEGATMCVLETLEGAQARGARIYAEILGGGLTADAYHITAPNPTGEGATRAMRLAMRHSGVTPESVDYICAHGTSTPLNDKAETLAIKAAFGEHAYRLAVSSPKSMTGHLMGAAGALSGAATALAIYHQELPPTINLDTPDPECDLDYVPNHSRAAPVQVALVNGFGFGGQNAVVTLAKVDR